MSFEVTYNGDIQYIKVFYSTAKTRTGKYYGEFYKQMDVLASDLKRFKQELDEDSEKAAKIAKDAANKALAERFGSLRYVIDERYWDEDMVISKILDDRKEEMLALAQKTFNHEVLLEEDGAEEYKIHLDEGGIEVDGESVETSVMELFDSDDYHNWNEAKLETLEKLDWFIIWSRTEAGEFKAEGGQHDGNFSLKELNMKNCLLTYRDLPLVVPSNGTDIFSNELEIHFVDETKASLNMS
ncbi:hypothetical protein [Prochlorococcus marinus]|uniref:Uncharacterized protein n=1 Tax=Prochlorococcus marinus XMU1408 TaxID=2213228 RepID=A0A318RII3_PROMR|nr:hypothetical protein [Prochlorococcus marinus]MBW3041037.1 hypothetical protein [Prochlorococcus marinus str. XMU1408]PYE03662.1 hypothetical protein DNJ73_00285 [Prochlorococcus marinus XMU1408]